ncbi:MAG: hypothetical protein NZ899_12875 [Thermoguttaceae bacterium]|nr:hypothetical protein [Thermoguttaceae bacterium]
MRSFPTGLVGVVTILELVGIVVASAAFVYCGVLDETSAKPSEALASRYPRVDLKADCGAKGDGQSDDTAAFQKAAELLQQAGGGTLIIPPGTYIVGRQYHTPGQYPYYQTEPIFAIKNLKFLSVEGNEAIIRRAAGLRFGAFDKDTGEPFQAEKMPFVDWRYAAHVANIFDIGHSQNVWIKNLELDGNVTNLVIGGEYGDTGRQLPGTGIFLHNCSHVWIDRVHSHHHPLDGIMIAYYQLKESDPATPHILTDCVFEYNGRQGLSWVGGRGLRAYRCKFRHTGRALNGGKPFASAPGAGVDIEAEESICRDGYFEECEFVNNIGCGMVADSGDGGYSRFVRCLFWGVTSWSAWSAKPGLVYEDCMFHGSIVHAYGSDDQALATRWVRCTFEDLPWEDGRQPYGQFLAELNGNLRNVTFEQCVFRANQCRSIWCSGQGFRFVGCSFIHKFAGVADGDYQAILRGGTTIGCHFREDFPESVNARWSILVDRSQVAPDPPTIVDGPRVRWGSPDGPVGIIPPSQ